MDTFIDKLAQKFTAQEIIKANAAAEAAELQRTRETAKHCESYIKENKLAVEDAKEAVAMLEQTVNTGMERLSVDNVQLENTITDFVHKENVKVYRNVQAAMVDELAKQTEELSSKLEGLSRKNKALMGIALTSMIASLLSVGALIYLVLCSLGILTF